MSHSMRQSSPHPCKKDQPWDATEPGTQKPHPEKPPLVESELT